jgi:hypothetical protein
MVGIMWKSSKWLFLCGGIALGFVAGQGISVMGSKLVGSQAASDETPRRVRAKSPTAATEAERTRAARLARIREVCVTDDYKAREKFTGELGAGDVPDLLAVFLEDAGLEGIGYREEELLGKAVEKWVAEDVNAALAWAANLPQPKLRRYFQKMMLGEIAKTDPFGAADRALEIEAGDKEFDASNIVSDGIRELAKKSGQERAIADLVRKTSVKDGNGSMGISQTFAEDFGHEALLDSLAEMKSQGLEFRFMPTGMLEAWAMRDPEAAHAWSLSKGSVGFEEWEDVLAGVNRKMGQEASGEWFLEKYSEADGERRKMMVDAFDDTYDLPAARMVLADRLARQMPEELAGEFVEGVLKAHLGMFSDKQAEGLALLAWYPTPEERADVMIRHAGYSGVEKLLERFPESRLETYGVSRETLEAAAGRAKNSE